MPFEAPRVHLTGICGLGSRGREVVNLVAAHLGSFPEAMKRATATAIADNIETLGEVLKEMAESLLQRDNVEAIEKLGWRLEGREGIAVELDLVVVGSFEEARRAWTALEASQWLLQQRYARLRWVALCESVTAALADELRWPESQPLDLIGRWTRSNLSAGDAALPAAVATFLLASTVPEVGSRLNVSSRRIASFGAAGYYGLTGPLRQQLGAFVGRRLIEVHLQDEVVRTGSRALPGELEEFLAAFSPTTLALRLFDPRLFDELKMRPLPAVPQWSADKTTLEVRLDRGAIALELEGLSPRLWSSRIRSFSRGFDMSLAAVWCQKLGRAARVLRQELSASFLLQFKKLLGTLSFSPAWLRRLLAELRQALRTRFQAMPVANAALEPALENLNAAVAAMPNVLALTARMLLWVIPAVVVGVSILFAVYPTPRAWVLTVFLIVSGTLGVGLGVLGPWLRARHRLYAARDQAIDIVRRRQEVLVSENAVGFLADLVATLNVLADQAQRLLEEYRRRLEEAVQQLKEHHDAPLEETSFFAPVVGQLTEIEELYRQLGIREERWLDDAVRDGLFTADDTKPLPSWLRELTGWCATKVCSGETRGRVLGFRDLWAIRASTRREPELPHILKRLWQRAEPLSESSGADEITIFVVPEDVAPEVQESLANARKYGAEEVVVVTPLPLLLCIRHRYLTVARGGAR